MLKQRQRKVLRCEPLRGARANSVLALWKLGRGSKLVFPDLDVHPRLEGFEALDAIGDAVFTGNTGTNLCDFNVMYVPKID